MIAPPTDIRSAIRVYYAAGTDTDNPGSGALIFGVVVGMVQIAVPGLPEPVRQLMEDGKLSSGHARALLGTTSAVLWDAGREPPGTRPENSGSARSEAGNEVSTARTAGTRTKMPHRP